MTIETNVAPSSPSQRAPLVAPADGAPAAKAPVAPRDVASRLDRGLDFVDLRGVDLHALVAERPCARGMYGVAARGTAWLDGALCGRAAPKVGDPRGGTTGNFVGWAGREVAKGVGLAMGLAGWAVGLAVGLVATVVTLGRVKASDVATGGCNFANAATALTVGLGVSLAFRAVQAPTRLLRGVFAGVGATVGVLGGDALVRRQQRAPEPAAQPQMVAG